MSDDWPDNQANRFRGRYSRRGGGQHAGCCIALMSVGSEMEVVGLIATIRRSIAHRRCNSHECSCERIRFVIQLQSVLNAVKVNEDCLSTKQACCCHANCGNKPPKARVVPSQKNTPPRGEISLSPSGRQHAPANYVGRNRDSKARGSKLLSRNAGFSTKFHDASANQGTVASDNASSQPTLTPGKTVTIVC
jgi:hypothetical protein